LVRMYKELTSANDALELSYDQLNKKIKNFETSISKSKSVSQIKEMRQELEKLQKAQSKHPANNNPGKNAFIAGIKSYLPSTSEILAYGQKALNSAFNSQSRKIAYTTSAGKKDGAALNDNLNNYAKDSIYGNEVHKNAQAMLSMGINAKDIIPNIKMLGDVALGNTQNFEALTKTFSQVSAAGKLTEGDLTEFTNAGFNPLEEIARKTGIGMGDLKKAVSEGAVTFNMIKSAFQSATGEGGKFYNMTNQITESDFGKVQTFSSNLENLAMKVGESLAPAVGILIGLITPLVDLLTTCATWMSQNTEAIQTITTVLGVATIAYGLYTVAMNAGAIAMAAFNLVGSLNPIGAFIAAIAGLVAGVIYAWNKFEGFRQAVWGLWGAFKQIFENIGSLFKRIFEPIFEAITAFKEGRFLDAGKALAKTAYNLSPQGLVHNIVKFSQDGGFTKGVADAYNKESVKGILKKDQKKSILSVADNTGMDGAFVALKGNKSKGEVDDTIKGITSGGPRVININGVRFADKIEIHASSFEKGMDNVKDILDEYLLRILNSGAVMQ